MKKLFVILMLFATVAFATPFKMSMLDGGNVLYVQKHPQKAGYTIVTVQLANTDIYVVETDKNAVIRKVFYWDGTQLVLVFNTHEA